MFVSGCSLIGEFFCFFGKMFLCSICSCPAAVPVYTARCRDALQSMLDAKGSTDLLGKDQSEKREKPVVQADECIAFPQLAAKLDGGGAADAMAPNLFDISLSQVSVGCCMIFLDLLFELQK